MDKYFLIPDHVYSRAGIKTSKNHFGSKEILDLPAYKNSPVQELQTELNSLNAKETLTPELKWEQYRHIFDKFFSHKASQNNNIYMQSTSNSDTEENLDKKNVDSKSPFDLDIILKSFPKSLKNTIEIFYNLFSHSADFKNGIYGWSKKGELLVNGQPILGSNVFDMLDYLLRKRIKAPVSGPPAGWNLFYHTVLPSINFPQHLKAPFLTRSGNPFSFDNDTDLSDGEFYNASENQPESTTPIPTKRAKRRLKYEEENKGNYASWEAGI